MMFIVRVEMLLRKVVLKLLGLGFIILVDGLGIFGRGCEKYNYFYYCYYYCGCVCGLGCFVLVGIKLN